MANQSIYNAFQRMRQQIAIALGDYAKKTETATKEHTHTEYAPTYTYSQTDLNPGVSTLETGKLYFVYE